ncbi:chaplin family protein, partial [Streptomyces sp. Act-28]
MRHIRRSGLVALMATGGALALATGSARADADAFAAAFDSAGQVAGDEVRLPADSPVSVCGDTANAEGLLDPAAGSTCADRNGSGASRAGGQDDGRGGATAVAGVIGSSDAFSEDGVRLPFDSPVEVSGDAVSIVVLDDQELDEGPGDSGGKPPAKPATPAKP